MSLTAARVTSISTNNETGMHTSKVTSTRGDSVIIQLNNKEVPARIAFSCLVQPIVGDKVLIANDGDAYFILSVLERNEGQDMSLSVPGSLLVESRQGSIQIKSKETVTTVAKKINNVSEEALLSSKQAYLKYDQVSAVGSKATVNFDQIRTLSNLISTMAKQVLQKFQIYTRHTEVHDQVKAAQMTKDVRGLYTMESNYTVMVSKKETKIDGAHIHMG